MTDRLQQSIAIHEDDGSCADCSAKAHPEQFDPCADCGAECGHAYCHPCPETFEDQIGCDMCGAHIDDPCDCFDSQTDRRTR